MELKAITSLLEEIDYLKKKAKLFDEIMNYYDKEEMTINIPSKWNNERLLPKTMSKSPRHHLNKKIEDNLPYSESDQYVNWEKNSEKL